MTVSEYTENNVLAQASRFSKIQENHNILKLHTIRVGRARCETTNQFGVALGRKIFNEIKMIIEMATEQCSNA